MRTRCLAKCLTSTVFYRLPAAVTLTPARISASLLYLHDELTALSQKDLGFRRNRREKERNKISKKERN
jgi:hypothetical protein